MSLVIGCPHLNKYMYSHDYDINQKAPTKQDRRPEKMSRHFGLVEMYVTFVVLKWL